MTHHEDLLRSFNGVNERQDRFPSRVGRHKKRGRTPGRSASHSRTVRNLRAVLQPAARRDRGELRSRAGSSVNGSGTAVSKFTVSMAKSSVPSIVALRIPAMFDPNRSTEPGSVNSARSWVSVYTQGEEHVEERQRERARAGPVDDVEEQVCLPSLLKFSVMLPDSVPKRLLTRRLLVVPAAGVHDESTAIAVGNRHVGIHQWAFDPRVRETAGDGRAGELVEVDLNRVSLGG